MEKVLDNFSLLFEDSRETPFSLEGEKNTLYFKGASCVVARLLNTRLKTLCGKKIPDWSMSPLIEDKRNFARSYTFHHTSQGFSFDEVITIVHTKRSESVQEAMILYERKWK